jgi:phenylalanyl-tRNA synthetase alpha chain
MYTVEKLAEYSGAALDQAVAELLRALEDEAAAVSNEADWKTFRDRWMARKNGVLTQINEVWLKAAPGPQKREVGRRVNELKSQVEQGVASVRERLAGGATSSRIEGERLDVTLPGIRRPIGAQHPVMRAMNDMVAVFRNMGPNDRRAPFL